MAERDYHDYPAWSYSKIAKYAKNGFAALATLDARTEPTPSMIFGSLFDCMMTRGKDATKSEYAVFERSVPDAERKVLDRLAATSSAERFGDIANAEIAGAAEACQYYPKWGYDAKYKHLSEYSDYYEAKRSGKTLVSRDDWSDAFNMMMIFRNDPYLKELFGTRSTETVEYLYQTQFVTDYTLPSGRVVPVKIMPDLLKINHEDRTVQPVDLKTSADPAWNFKENFIRFAYYIQAKLYSDVIESVMANDEELKSYTVLPYLFTDISRTDMVPVTYIYDQTSEAQADGFTFTSGEKTYSYKSWQTMLDEILDYREAEAKVPSYISTEVPNDILNIIGTRQ